MTNFRFIILQVAPECENLLALRLVHVLRRVGLWPKGYVPFIALKIECNQFCLILIPFDRSTLRA